MFVVADCCVAGADIVDPKIGRQRWMSANQVSTARFVGFVSGGLRKVYLSVLKKNQCKSRHTETQRHRDTRVGMYKHVVNLSSNTG